MRLLAWLSSLQNRRNRCRTGCRYKEEGYIHISNVMPIVPSTGKPTRVQIKQSGNGQKERIAAGTHEVL